MTEYMARSEWISAGRGGAQLTGGSLQGIAGHWPGTSTPAYGVEAAATVAARIRGWWDYHVNIREWSDIGYNVAGDQAGRIWDLRGIGRVGAHAASATNPDANHEWVGFLFILGADEEPTPELIRAFQDFRHDVFLPRWPGRNDVTGHGRAPGVEGAQTSCPGQHVAAGITSGVLLTQTPREQEDDMTPDQLLDALDSDRGQGILANAVAKSIRDGHVTRRELQSLLLDPGDIRDAADRDTKQGRHLGTNLKDALIDAGLGKALSDQVVDDLLNYTNPGVDGGEDTVYRILRDIREAVAG